MRIGILTFHRACNYGAYLQACCLCKRLIQEGFQAEIIDYYTYNESKKYKQFEQWSLLGKIKSHRKYLFEKEKYYAFQLALKDTIINTSDETLCSDNIAEFQHFVNGKYDLIITGSDEVFKLDGLRGFPSAYWLPGELGCTKMSYAASGRSGLNVLSDEMTQILKELLSDFKVVSVRDGKSFNTLSTIRSDIRIDCDPSFLYKFNVPNVNVYDFFSNRIRLDKNKKCIVVMLYDPNEEVSEWIINELSNRYNLISVAEYHKKMINIGNLTPREWLILLNNCDLVISSFFHGVCFSISLNTPFVAIENVEKDSKLSFLLRDSELSDRFIEFREYRNFNLKNEVDRLMRKTNYDKFFNKQSINFNSYLNEIRKVK